jgi:hypothetical protein
MSCPGLHCPGCSAGQSLGILAAAIIGLAVAAETVRWVAERIWWIGGTLAVCFALAVAGASWLERWADRRGARFAAAHGILSRADVILPARPPLLDFRTSRSGRRSDRPPPYTSTSMAYPVPSRPPSSARHSLGKPETPSPSRPELCGLIKLPGQYGPRPGRQQDRHSPF